MPLSFNNAGPQRPGKHYTLDPLRRVDADEILRLIEAERYFVLHAPRQTGKTSCLLALRDMLNAEGKYRALYINIESAKAVPEQQVQVILAGVLGSMIEQTFPQADGMKLLASAKQTHPEEPFRRLMPELRDIQFIERFLDLPPFQFTNIRTLAIFPLTKPSQTTAHHETIPHVTSLRNSRFPHR